MTTLTLKDFVYFRCMLCHLDMLNKGTYCDEIVEKGIYCEDMNNYLKLADDFEKMSFAKKELDIIQDLQKKKNLDLKVDKENF